MAPAKYNCKHCTQNNFARYVSKTAMRTRSQWWHDCVNLPFSLQPWSDIDAQKVVRIFYTDQADGEVTRVECYVIDDLIKYIGTRTEHIEDQFDIESLVVANKLLYVYYRRDTHTRIAIKMPNYSTYVADFIPFIPEYMKTHGQTKFPCDVYVTKATNPFCTIYSPSAPYDVLTEVVYGLNIRRTFDRPLREGCLPWLMTKSRKRHYQEEILNKITYDSKIFSTFFASQIIRDKVRETFDDTINAVLKARTENLNFETPKMYKFVCHVDENFQTRVYELDTLQILRNTLAVFE